MHVAVTSDSRAGSSRGRGEGAILALRSAVAVRERCRMVYDWVVAGRSPHFTVEHGRLAAVVDYVAEVTRQDYPDLHIPYHSRWRHFSSGGVARWSAMAERLAADPTERARTAVDVATISVLLDAGAGPAWRYCEAETGLTFNRSEGLAVASLDAFRAGGFSSDPTMPWRADSAALRGIDAATLARAFQVNANNPLVGLEQRALLMRRLGAALEGHPNLFGKTLPRPGHLIDYVSSIAHDRRVRAADILAVLLEGLSAIWPSGLALRGIPIGDAGRHPAVRTHDDTDGVVPFHKLSQWLAYSLIEPLEEAGFTVIEIDALTTLPEYRNGGLLIDLGVICPRQPIDPAVPFDVASEFIVEWRALTVTLMDQLLGPVRERLGLGQAFTLPHLLQGGTWSAGRKIARTLRPPDGPPPIPVAADGTVF